MGVYSKARVFDAALPAADANLLSSDIQPTFDMAEFRILFAPSKQGRLSMKRMEIASGITVSTLLGTSNIGANEAVTFLIPTRAITRYNFTFSATNGKCLILQVDEVEG